MLCLMHWQWKASGQDLFTCFNQKLQDYFKTTEQLRQQTGPEDQELALSGQVGAFPQTCELIKCTFSFA